jgi:hypothetical protein
MRKPILALTIAIVAVAAAVIAVAGISAPRTGATPSLCHSTTLSIKAPVGVTAGKTVKVTGSEARLPGHTVRATLQFKKATAANWKNGASANLSASGAYSLKWKAPSAKGKYKLRVRVAYGGVNNTSVTKVIRVK